MSEQLSNGSIQEILDRNSLTLSFNLETNNYELHRNLRGGRKLKMGTCIYQTPLIAKARTIDRNRK